MGIKEEIKALLAKEAKMMTDIASQLYETVNKRAAMSNLNKTIKFEEVCKIANLLGYDIEFKKRK